MVTEFPHYVVWSTDEVDPTDPFQRRWILRQILMHGKADDIRALDLQEIAGELNELNLPPVLYQLWKRVLESRHAHDSASTG